MAKKKNHIDIKDNGIKLSQKIGDKLSDLKQTLETNIQDNLVKGIDNPRTWAIKQNILLRNFKKETAKIIEDTNKNVKNDLKTSDSVELKKKQITTISTYIDKGTLFLGNQAIDNYQKIIHKTMVTLRVEKAIELKDALSKHIQNDLNVGVVYKDGKHYKFDNYWEMKARTDIQQYIGKNMVDTGNSLGVIFYIAAYFGDCAKDHVDYQGKIYVDKDWEANAPKDRLEDIKDYINSNKIMTVQEVMGEPYYFTTRPNCRHYFQYVDIDSVLGAKNEKQVSNLRDDMGLNFNGKYRPDKYEALQQQRLNERKIRSVKEEVDKQEHLLALNPGDKDIQNKILIGENQIRRYQSEQVELVKKYNNLERRYDREQIGVNRVDFGIE